MFNKMLMSRNGSIWYMILFPIVFSAILGGLLFGGVSALIGGESFFSEFGLFTKFFYMAFAGWMTAGGLLVLFFKLPEEYAGKFGAGMHYGTILGAGFLNRILGVARDVSLGGAALVSALVCYIVWIQYVKPVYENWKKYTKTE